MTSRPEALAVERRPVAPAWFDAALAHVPERTHIEVEGAEIEVLTWGERGQPGLLLLHGFTAHADWWSFLAPLLAQGRRVVALSLSGMGRSGWRDTYSLEQHAREAIAVAEATGLFESATPPIVIGHSFGSFATRIVAHTIGTKLGGIVLVDGALAARDNNDEYDGVPVRGHRHRVYPTLEQAIARFRFEPAQDCDNPYIMDFLARTSLGLVAGRSRRRRLVVALRSGPASKDPGAAHCRPAGTRTLPRCAAVRRPFQAHDERADRPDPAPHTA